MAAMNLENRALASGPLESRLNFSFNEISCTTTWKKPWRGMKTSRVHLETTEFIREHHYCKTTIFMECSAADKAYLHVNFFDSHKNSTKLVPSFSRWYS